MGTVAIQVNGLMDGTSPFVPSNLSVLNGAGVNQKYPNAALIQEGQQESIYQGNLGLIDLNQFSRAIYTRLLLYCDIQGPNSGLIDGALSRYEVVRGPNYRRVDFGRPGPAFYGQESRPVLVPPGYVLRLRCVDGLGAPLAGPWQVNLAFFDIVTPKDFCCACVVAGDRPAECDPPSLDINGLTPPGPETIGSGPYSLTASGSGFLPGDQVLVEEVGPGIPTIGNVVVVDGNTITFDVTNEPDPGGYRFFIARAGDASCRSLISVLKTWQLA